MRHSSTAVTWVACACTCAIVMASTPSHAYEFWLRAQAYGQAYQLRGFRLVGPDLFLSRRRITHTLALRIFDVGDFSASRRRARLPDRGLRVSWHSYLRVDHDFGDFTSGKIARSGAAGRPGGSPFGGRDAIDVIPELADSVAALQLMYGFLEIDGLGGDRVKAKLGRVVVDDGWATAAIDGASGSVDLGGPFALSALAGLRVRASSPLGVSAYELDGTSGAGCREYVESAVPGGGAWQLIDRNRAVENRTLSSDYEYCPQRNALQPTVGISLATLDRKHWGAEVGYRRTWSRSVGRIGSVDRLDYPDVGLYPNEFGQAPASGVNEERIYGRFHAAFATPYAIVEPYSAARFSLLHGVVDRAEAGVRVRRGRHAVEPAIASFFPTFDGDSIFNVFSIEPSTDARLGYRFDGTDGWRGAADFWLRRYAPADVGAAFSGGGSMAVERLFGRALRGRVDALWDDGWGGRRIGGTAQAAWQRDQELWLRGRLIVLGVDPDAMAGRGARAYVTSSAVVSTTWRAADAVALHAVLEADRDAVHGFQTRAVVIFDLGFAPEP